MRIILIRCMRFQICLYVSRRAFCSGCSTVHCLKQRTVRVLRRIVRLNLPADIRCRNGSDLIIGIRCRRALRRTRLCVRILEHILRLALWVINACQHIARALAVCALLRDQQPVRGIGRRMSGRCSRAYIRRAVKTDLISGYIRLARAVLLPHVACFLSGLTGGFRSGAALFCAHAGGLVRLTGAFRAFSLLFRTCACLFRRFSCVLAAFAHSLRRSAVCLSRFPCVLVCNAGILGRNAVRLGIRSAGLGRNTRRFILCTDALCVRPLAFCRHAGRFGVHSACLSRNAAFLCRVALVLRIGAGVLCRVAGAFGLLAGGLGGPAGAFLLRTVVLGGHAGGLGRDAALLGLLAFCLLAAPLGRGLLHIRKRLHNLVELRSHAFPHQTVKHTFVLVCRAGQRVRGRNNALFRNLRIGNFVISNTHALLSSPASIYLTRIS